MLFAYSCSCSSKIAQTVADLGRSHEVVHPVASPDGGFKQFVFSFD